MSDAGSMPTRCLDYLIAVCLAGVMIAAVTSDIAAAPESLKNFFVHEAPKPLPTIFFQDDQGKTGSLADLKGRVVVLNLWATWCVPCRKEMPSLDRLQESLGGSDFAVAPVSIDRGGIVTVAKFYAEIGIHALPMYFDTSGQSLRELGAVGLPTTLILDRAGEEIARVIGPAEWDTPEVAEFLKPIIANESNPIMRARRGNDSGEVAQADAPGPFRRVVQWLKGLLVN
jgi:thiol-disulfide isomerase/thioredoxin